MNPFDALLLDEEDVDVAVDECSEPVETEPPRSWADMVEDGVDGLPPLPAHW